MATLNEAGEIAGTDGQVRGRLDGDHANLTLGGGGAEGDIALCDARGGQTVHIDGGQGNLTLGGAGAQGDIALLNADGRQTIHLDGGNGNLWLGGEGAQGDITLMNTDGDETIVLDGGEANVTIGGGGAQGDLVLLNARDAQTVHLDGGNGNLALGGEGAAGDIAMKLADGTVAIHLDANDRAIIFHGPQGEPSLVLDGEGGRVVVRGAELGADHVFAPGYRLAPLAEVAQHVANHGHLPGVAPAASMRAEGVDLAALSMTLLAKVEELTLHLIALEARLAALEGGRGG